MLNSRPRNFVFFMKMLIKNEVPYIKAYIYIYMKSEHVS